MTANQLVSLYQRAWHERPVIFGLPGGDLTPEETAGDMVQRLGLQRAREEAREQAGGFPAPWNHAFRVYEILCQTGEG